MREARDDLRIDILLTITQGPVCRICQAECCRFVFENANKKSVISSFGHILFKANGN